MDASGRIEELMRLSFAEVGELPFSLGDDDQRDLVMARPLVMI